MIIASISSGSMDYNYQVLLKKFLVTAKVICLLFYSFILHLIRKFKKILISVKTEIDKNPSSDNFEENLKAFFLKISFKNTVKLSLPDDVENSI